MATKMKVLTVELGGNEYEVCMIPNYMGSKKTRMIANIPVNDLTPASYNPKSRTVTIEGKRSPVADLIESVEEVGGIFEPILVNRDLQIIEGHRRWTALQAMGLSVATCVVLDVKKRKHKMVDLMECYLARKTSVHKKYRKIFEAIEKDIKRPSMYWMVKEGISYYVHSRAVDVCNYCGLEDTVTVMKWMRKEGTGSSMYIFVQRWMDSDKSPETLRKCVLGNKPLPMFGDDDSAATTPATPPPSPTPAGCINFNILVTC